ncbi:MAG: haloperoxidase [Acidobacteriota bacterium]
MTSSRSLPLLFVAALLLPRAVAGADVVLDWNELALAQVVAAGQLPPDGSRTMALVHVAMFDAVDAVDRRYLPYEFDERATGDVSAEAAAASAAHAILAGLFPDRRATVDGALAASLAALPDDARRRAGVALGEAVAARCLELRAGDGSAAPERYRPWAAPGGYVPTAIPVSSPWGAVRPWFLASGDELRPAAPPELAGDAWARDYEEVRRLGRRSGSARTDFETESARFWIVTGPAAWNPVVRALAASAPARLIDRARLFALVNLAAADAFVAVFDAKYTYGFWRPITAIRNGAVDGNDATGPEPGWLPLVDTPMHPEYPCAHCITAAAVARVLEAEFGAAEVPSIEMTSPTTPGVTHRWTRLSDYVSEVSNARVCGGIHYRTSTQVGEAMGRRIGELALARVLTPLDPTAAGSPSAPPAVDAADFPANRAQVARGTRAATQSQGTDALHSPASPVSKPSAKSEP